MTSSLALVIVIVVVDVVAMVVVIALVGGTCCCYVCSWCHCYIWCRRSSSCCCSCGFVVVVSRVCVVAIYSKLPRCSKSWCCDCVLAVGVLCLHCASFVCLCVLV